MKSRGWTKWLAIFFLALAVALTVAAFWPTQDALSSPVELRSGLSFTREFHIPKKARYRIEIRCSRSIPFEQLKKQLREGNLIEIKLLEDSAPVQLDYFQNPPFKPGVISTENEFGNLGFAEDYISQDIADFSGHPKHLYALTCTVVRPLQHLNSTHPTLIVALDPLELESRAVGGLVLLAAALLSGFISLIFALVFCYQRRCARSRAARLIA